MQAPLRALLVLAAMLAMALAPGMPGAGAEENWRRYPYQAGPFTFPLDEDRHDDLLALPTDLLGQSHGHALVEWWYTTGELWSTEGRAFGIMVSFQRFGQLSKLSSEVIFGLTDVTAQQHYPSHLDTLAPDMAPAPGKLDLRVGDSTLRQVEGEPFVYQLEAVGGRARASLRMEAMVPPFLPHGGTLHMGPLPNPATRSAYYTLPWLALSGTVTIDGVAHEVAGQATMDHEWYLQCSCLGNDWAYYSMRLDNGLSANFYVFYDTNLLLTKAFDARLPSGARVSADDFGFEVLGHWQKRRVQDVALGDAQGLVDAAQSKRYTHGWRFGFPDELRLTMLPRVADQETQRGFEGERFWEGTTEVHGTWRGAPVHGYAYAEIWHDSRQDVPPQIP
jgi:predicted secreted hydrolase